MIQNRKKISYLQNVIFGVIEEKSLSSDVVISGIGEFLIHYCVTQRGTNFTAGFLEKLVDALGVIQESAALANVESGNSVSTKISAIRRKLS